MQLFILILVFIIPIGTYLYRGFILNKYAVEESLSNLNGLDISRKILDVERMEEVIILETTDELQAKYDPNRKTIKFTKDVFNNSSITTTAVASFECAHASLNRDTHVYYNLREKINPLFRYTSDIGYMVALLGFLLNYLDLYYLGICLCSFGIIFELVTLPIEFEAKKRAISFLKENGLVMPDEEEKVNTVINAYSLTYVANLIGELRFIFNAVVDYFKKD